MNPTVDAPQKIRDYTMPLVFSPFVLIALAITAAAQVKDDKDAVPITYHVPEGLSTPEHYRFEQPIQSGTHCGPNSLYILLGLSGIRVNYDDLVNRIDAPAEGWSLDQLQETGMAYGLRSHVRKVTLRELDLVPAPYILHFNTPPESVTGARDHFVVITRREPQGALVGVEPTSGAITTWSKAFLSRNFSGYVLLPQGGPVTPLSATKVAIGISLAVLMVLNITLARRSPAGACAEPRR